MEPTSLNSTAEPLTPTIHQCRGVTRQAHVTEIVDEHTGVGDWERKYKENRLQGYLEYRRGRLIERGQEERTG